MPRYSCFLSYSRKDKAFVDELSKVLRADGLEHWVDRSEIQAGDQWEKSIHEGMRRADACVVFVSEHTIGSFVAKEVALANEMRKRIIPVALDDTITSSEDQLIVQLRRWHFIDFRDRGTQSGPNLIAAIRKAHLASVVAMYNVKGGVGKTTLAIHLGTYYYFQRHKRVLMIDADPQANLSSSLVRPKLVQAKSRFLIRRTKPPQIINILEQSREEGKIIFGLWNQALDTPSKKLSDYPNSFITNIHGASDSAGDACLDILCGDPRMAQFASSAKTIDLNKVKSHFDDFINENRKLYDIILIDMNPSISHITDICLASSTHILSPVQPDAYSMQGLDLLDNLIEQHEGAALSRDRIIVINDPSEDADAALRKELMASKYADFLIDAELPYSKPFVANISAVSDPLTKLPAFGKWSDTPAKHRKSLRDVAEAVAERVGLLL